MSSPLCPAFHFQIIGSVITKSHQLRLVSTTWHSGTIRKRVFGWHPHSLCYFSFRRGCLHLCQEVFFCTSPTFPLQQDCTSISIGSLFCWVVGATLLLSRILWKAALLELFKSILTTILCGLHISTCCGSCAERIRFWEVSGSSNGYLDSASAATFFCYMACLSHISGHQKQHESGGTRAVSFFSISVLSIGSFCTSSFSGLRTCSIEIGM
jgi:hypothetical protein